MTTRTLLQGLLTTTAFVAAASAAQATTYTSNSTVSASTVDGPITVNSGVTVSVSTGPAFLVSGTSEASNTINIAQGGTVIADSEVISVYDVNAASTTINVAGNLTRVSGSEAISATYATNRVSLNNSGTISGSVTLGTGNDIVTNTNVITGALATGDGDDSVANSGTITGAVNLGNGTNSYTQTGGLLTGDLTAGTGADTVTVSGGRINGNVNLGGTANNTLTLNGGTVSGTITAGNGTGDTINFRGAEYSLLDSISGFENMNVSNTLNVTKGVTGVDTLTVGSGGVVNVLENMALASNGNANISGTVNIGGGKTLTLSGTGDARLASGGVLGINVDSSSSVGKLVLAGGFGGGSVTINMGENVGFIASGTSYTIIDGGAASTNASLTTATKGLYSFTVSTTSGGQDISLTINRAAVNTLVESDTSKAIGNILDAAAGTASGDLLTVQSNLSQASSAAEVNAIVESLAPATDTGAAIVSVGVGTAAGQNVSTRLASLRGYGDTGLSTGSRAYSNNMWVQGFGSVQNQDDKDGAAGYDANTAGATFGIDTDGWVDGMTTGLAFTYGKSAVESNGAGNAETDVDSYLATLYGSKVYDHGYFVNGQVGLGFNRYDSERQVIGFGSKTTGDWDGLQGTAKVETGRDIDVGNGLTLTPLASLQYTYLKMDDYTETGPAALTVDSKSYNSVDAGLGAELGWNVAMEDGSTLRPNLRAKYVYRGGSNNVETTSSFVAGGGAFSTQGVEADRSSVNLGAGVLLTTVGGIELSADYDADIRSSLTGHTGQLKAKWAF